MTLEMGFAWVRTTFRLLGSTSQTFELCDLSLVVVGHKDHAVLLERLVCSASALTPSSHRSRSEVNSSAYRARSSSR
jgi:hypothetical protein